MPTRCGGAKPGPVMVDGMAIASKAALRVQLLAARRCVADDVRAAEARSLCGRRGPGVTGAATVCAHVPVGTERGSVELPEMLLRRSRRVLLPAARTGGPG